MNTVLTSIINLAPMICVGILFIMFNLESKKLQSRISKLEEELRKNEKRD